jgi:hypothetical protein
MSASSLSITALACGLWLGLLAPTALAGAPEAPPGQGTEATEAAAGTEATEASEAIEVAVDADIERLEQVQRLIEARRLELEELDARMAELRARLDEAQAADPTRAAGRMQMPAHVDDEERGAHVVVRVDDEVGDAVAYGEDLVVLGRVRGDATAFGGDVRVGPGARIEGDAVSFGGEVFVDDGGVVEGNRIAMAAPQAEEGLLALLTRRLVFLLSFAGAGVLVIGLFPDRVGRVAETIRAHPVRSGITGAGLTLGLVMVSVLFAVLILPLPLAVAIVAGLGAAWMMGFVALCQALGDRLPFRERHHGRWAAFLVGTVAVCFVSTLSWVGVVALVIASAVGLGAALSTKLGARSVA